MKTGDFDWTDERIAELTALCATDMSASEIAVEMRCGTRNAVIGKILRLGLARPEGTKRSPKPHPKHRPKPSPVRREKFKPHVRLAVPPPAPEPLPVMFDDTAIPIKQRKTLLELDQASCRWPCGTPGTADFYFCGAPEADFPTIVYCRRHAALAYAGTGRSAQQWPSWAGGGRGRKSGRARG